MKMLQRNIKSQGRAIIAGHGPHAPGAGRVAPLGGMMLCFSGGNGGATT
jgi:hypothetical protein